MAPTPERKPIPIGTHTRQKEVGRPAMQRTGNTHFDCAPVARPSMAYRSTKPARVTLSRPFSDLVVELSIALQKFVMYPEGHPSLGPAVASVVRRAERIMEDRPSVAFGVARHQLIIEGVVTDPRQPVLRRLADSLNRHHLGAISLSRGLTPAEISDALRQVGADTNTTVPIGLRPPHALPSWPHVRLHPLTFDRLTLVTDATATSRKSDDDMRAMELWIGLATAAIAKAEGPSDSEPIPTEPAVIARAIDEHARVEAYDQVIVGYLQQIARELKTASGAEVATLRRRTARLLATLKPDTLRRLVEMGGDVGQRRTFVLDAAHGMAMDSVLGILAAAADASGQVISHGLVRMFSKLAAQADDEASPVREMASDALREQVDRLMKGWELDDPTPAEYSQLLQRLAMSASAGSPGSDCVHNVAGSDLVRVVQMGLEVGTPGVLLDRTIDRVIHEGHIGSVLALVATAPPGSGVVLDAMLKRLTHPYSIGRLVSREPPDFVSLEQLLPALPLDAHRVLLDALSNTDRRHTRRKLLDLLAQSHVDIASLAIERLSDERWFVQRNMLVLIHACRPVPASFSAAPWTTHPDARVRYEALRLQLTIPGERSDALRAAISEPEPRFVRLGLAALQEECPPNLVGPVADIARNPDASEQLRTLAVRALAHVVPPSRDPRILEALLASTDGGTTLFGKPKLPAPTPRVLAALSALQEHWSTDEPAAMVLALARESDDRTIRRAVQRDHAGK